MTQIYLMIYASFSKECFTAITTSEIDSNIVKKLETPAYHTFIMILTLFQHSLLTSCHVTSIHFTLAIPASVSENVIKMLLGMCGV